MPLIVRRVVDLPAPFEPMRVTISPLPSQCHALQRVDVAVVGVDVVELEDVRHASSGWVCLPR